MSRGSGFALGGLVLHPGVFDTLNSEVAYEGSYKNVLHGCTEIHTNGEQFAPLTWMPQCILITCLFLISVFRLVLVFCSLLMSVWTIEVI